MSPHKMRIFKSILHLFFSCHESVRGRYETDIFYVERSRVHIGL